MEKSKGTNRPRVSDDSTQHTVAPILSGSQSVAVLDACAPPSDFPFPLANVIVDADVLAQYVAAPTIVVAGNHQHVCARFLEVGECGENAEARPRNYRAPFKPKLEEITVDYERRRTLSQLPQELDDVALDRWLCKAKV
jgi:hypothetical protein